MRNAWERLAPSVVAALLAVAMLPQVAIAAQAPTAAPPLTVTATPTAPLASGPLDGQIWPGQEGQQTAVIVDVTLDPSVKLPVRVRIPIPKGAVVQWAGEILDGDASNDQERTPTVHTGSGGSFAEFTLSVSHRGQIDTGGIPMIANGTQVSSQVDWIQSVASTSTQLSVRLPAGVSAVQISPSPVGSPDTNSAGESLYTLAPEALQLGAVSAVKLSYSLNPAGTPAAASGNLTAVYSVLGTLLVVLVAVVAFLMSRQGRAGGGDESDDTESVDSDEGDDDGPAESNADDSDAETDALPDEPSSDEASSDDDPFDMEFDDE